MTVTRQELEAGTIDFGDIDEPGAEPLPPVHPGDILSDWMADFRLDDVALAGALGLAPVRLTSVREGRAPITPELALRLAACFTGSTAGYWMSLQSRHDLELTRRELGERIVREVTPQAA